MKENSENKVENDSTTSSSVCIAIAKENEVVVFDAYGEARSFSLPEGGKIKKRLCFSTHGAENYIDDMLTPCFDEDLKHGEPEEDCYCGISYPHIHAHIHDPKTCGKKNNCDISQLARVVLHPTKIKEKLLHIPVTEQTPNQCNGNELSNLGIESKKNIRMHKVQHDDHVDYLVHHPKSGKLYLEHPCDTCESSDVHGIFNSVGSRKLKRDDREKDLHFYEPAPEPFSVQDFLSSMYDIDSFRAPLCSSLGNNNHKAEEESPKTTPISSCCSGGSCTALKTAAAEVIPPDETAPLLKIQKRDYQSNNNNYSTVRSTFTCKGICCSSEVPLIKDVLCPLIGVKEVSVNVPLKQVYVDHNTKSISASHIFDALKRNQFGPTLKRDGGATTLQQLPNNKANAKGRSQFFVNGICCASEIPLIDDLLRPMQGVDNIKINVTTKTVYVDHDTSIISAQVICDYLNKDGFGASIRRDAGEIAALASNIVRSVVTIPSSIIKDDDMISMIENVLNSYEFSQMRSYNVDVDSKSITLMHNPLILPINTIVNKLQAQKNLDITIEIDGADSLKLDTSVVADDDPIGVEEGNLPSTSTILAGMFWIVSMFSYVGGTWDNLKYVGLVSVAFGVPSIGHKAFRTIMRCKLDSNCLMLFASLGAIALQQFMEAASVAFLFSISEWLEARATFRARNALSEIVQLRPEVANLTNPITKEVTVVAASLVPVGEMVVVKAGDKVPCDGVVVEGKSTVDESSLTGESRPVRKGPGDTVSGGTINSGSVQLLVQTTSTADDSAVARLIRLVEEAQSNRSETEKIVDEFAKYYIPIVVFASLCCTTIPWFFGVEIGREWTQRGLVLMVIACPCALIISTPVTYVAGLAATAQKGVIIKGGAYLEALGLVESICFDKTGTLTQGKFALLHLDVVEDKYPREQIMQFLTLMEERATHPLAQALIDGAKKENVRVPTSMSVSDHTFLPGEGVSGKINGLEILVGNERLFRRQNLLSDRVLQRLTGNWDPSLLNGATTVGFMSIEGAGIVCAYCVADAVREESKAVVQELLKMGINVTMLTGDKKESATAIGSLVGLSKDEILSELLPDEKLTFINSLKNNGHGRLDQFSPLLENKIEGSILTSPTGTKKRRLVLMCGDGVNDAPALAAADVGVAMGAGAAIAMETADVTLMDSHLSKLLYSLNMGKRVIRKIKENVIFSLTVKFVVMVFALCGYADLWIAIVSDVGSMILVTLNGMQLLPPTHTQKETEIETSSSSKATNIKDIEQGGSYSSLGDNVVSTSCSSRNNNNCCGKNKKCKSKEKKIETSSSSKATNIDDIDQGGPYGSFDDNAVSTLRSSSSSSNDNCCGGNKKCKSKK